MKRTNTIVGVQHGFDAFRGHSLGFTGILQGYDLSATVYAAVQKVESVASSVRGIFSEWAARSQGRKDLARLSPRMLSDIGLEPFQAQAEINKPFWKK